MHACVRAGVLCVHVECVHALDLDLIVDHDPFGDDVTDGTSAHATPSLWLEDEEPIRLKINSLYKRVELGQQRSSEY